MLPTQDSLQGKRHPQTESAGIKKDISCKWKWQERGGSNIHTDKTDFKTKAIMKDKEGYYIMIKR